MKYEKKVKLKDNRTCLIRNGNEKDALVMLNMYIDVQIIFLPMVMNVHLQKKQRQGF